MRMLLVDDHPLFTDGLKDLLTRNDILVIGTAHDGLEALQQSRTLHPDTILMDVHMPRCDGLTATRLIKAEFPQIKIVMLTMAEDDEILFEAIKSGAGGYLLKTLDTPDFLQMILDLEQGEVPLAPGLAKKILGEFARQPTINPPTEENRLTGLTSRQHQILNLAAQKMTYKEIGAALGLTERTIKYHMGEIMEHLHLQNRAEVLAYARRMQNKNH